MWETEEVARKGIMKKSGGGYFANVLKERVAISGTHNEGHRESILAGHIERKRGKHRITYQTELAEGKADQGLGRIIKKYYMCMR